MRFIDEFKDMFHFIMYALRCLLMFSILLFPLFIVIFALCSCTTAQLPDNCKVHIIGNDITPNQYETICE